MTFYKIIPVVVEAHRFDGSEENIEFLTNWVISNGGRKPLGYPNQEPWVSTDGITGHAGWPAQFDLRLNRVKVAAVGDYITRLNVEAEGESKTVFKVYTEKYFKSTYENVCQTCTGRVRETTNLVCQSCGHDYAKEN